MNLGLADSTINAIAVAGGDLFAGTNVSVFVSSDSGKSWAQVPMSSCEPAVVSFAASGSSLLAGTDRLGLFVSANQGVNWSAVGVGLPSVSDYDIYVLSVSRGKIYAGTIGMGIFRATDSDTGWTDINLGLTNASVYALACTDSTVFAGTWAGVFRSTNDGVQWVSVNNGLIDEVGSPRIVYALAEVGTNLFAGTESGGAYLSTDNGSTWKAVNNGLASASGNPWCVQSFAVSGDTVYAATLGGGVFLSIDCGTHWMHLGTGLTNNNVGAIAVSGMNLYAGTMGGVFLSVAGGRVHCNKAFGSRSIAGRARTPKWEPAGNLDLPVPVTKTVLLQIRLLAELSFIQTCLLLFCAYFDRRYLVDEPEHHVCEEERIEGRKNDSDSLLKEEFRIPEQKPV